MIQQRLRDHGFPVGRLPTGSRNCITDVADVRVGHITLREPDKGICTGVTAILPHGGNPFRVKSTAASHVINGFGKTTGLVQVEELGTLESPLLLTNTFGVPAATEGALRWLMERDPSIGDSAGSVNVVTAECNDGWLNDLRGLHVRPGHAFRAIECARGDRRSEEGSIGAGTGMICFGWKGGIGTSSRRITTERGVGHIGVLTLTNFGRPEDLTILGVPMDRIAPETMESPPDGSVIIVLATDLPMDARQLKRVARRSAFGLARTGSFAYHGSGDIVIAFSNARLQPHVPDDSILSAGHLAEDGPLISRCFRAAAEATEEAVYNSLFQTETITGRQGRSIPILPPSAVLERLKEAGLLGRDV
ncbi:D-aminopeptidase [Melghirimyces profundicolus]|uniref:D-aminopeptidase n=1 Tax=Melghirimyces profundicolus TaxID=1242148 RepID=A0A2T6C4S1_9BACL|nr:P1 family peptidase [Melghirimyces profundicolus]PTX63316.1 D-aminopeptidase [Melghirimyces profundicolus]